MRSPLLAFSLAGFLLGAGSVFGQSLNNAFDNAGGANSYQGFTFANWVENFPDMFSIGPNAGGDFFATANGTPGAFLNVGFTKDLGGTILNQPYTISLEVSYYGSGLAPIVFSDFSLLRIGGPSGSVIWTSTPTPTAFYQWVQWTGTYTPTVGDVGDPFTFQAVFDEQSGRSLAIDGPVTATPTPEPTAALLLSMGAAIFGGLARRRCA